MGANNELVPGDEVNIKMINIILKIPKESVRLAVTASIMDDDGSLYEVHAILSPSEIREARRDFLDNVECGDDYDAIYALTDKGRELARRMDAGEDGLWDSMGSNDLGGE